jgi:hypothetical protein
MGVDPILRSVRARRCCGVIPCATRHHACRGELDFYGITLGFALASLGFGLYRPGFTTGASLAVRRFEQGDVAGKIASINGSAYIVTPAIGVALFNWWEPATFILMGAGCCS